MGLSCYDRVAIPTQERAMRNKSRIAIAGLALLAAGGAQAFEQYVGAQFIRSESSCQGFVDGVAPLGLTATCKEHDNGYRINYGIRANDYFGLEVGYQDAGEGKADAFANGSRVLTLTAPLTAWDLVFTSRAPLAYDVALVGRIGAARWEYEVTADNGAFGASNRKTTLTYGVGVEWSHLTLGYDVIQDVGQGNKLNPAAPDIKQDVKRWSLGLKYRF
jgi:hypothetical protein